MTSNAQMDDFTTIDSTSPAGLVLHENTISVTSDESGKKRMDSTAQTTDKFVEISSTTNKDEILVCDIPSATLSNVQLSGDIGITFILCTSVLNSTFNPPLSADAYSWVISVLALGGAIGGFCGGSLVWKVGPKFASILTDLLFFLAGLILFFATNIAMLIVGRIFLGIASGLCCSTVPLYINDITPVIYRGAFGTLHQISVNMGITLGASLGVNGVFGTPSLWKYLWALPAAISVLHATLMMFLPDSPKYLFKMGKEDNAKVALRRIRGSDSDINNEIAEFQREISEQQAKQQQTTRSVLRTLPTLFTPLLRERMIESLVVSIAQQLCGINAILFYSTSIFAQAGVQNTELATVMVTIVLFLTTFPSSFAIERAGRKVLLIVGLVGMGLSLVAFAVCLSLNWSWPGVACILLGVSFFSFGPGPVPWMLVPEILPECHRDVGVSVAVGTNWFFAFVVGQVYPSMNSALGTYSFLPFAGMCFTIAAYVFFRVPETKVNTNVELYRIL
eukprot:CFRG4509T1